MFRKQRVKCCLLLLPLILTLKFCIMWSSRESTLKCSKMAETVHLGMVVTDSSKCRLISLLIKSVLLHRSGPIHFHFLTDASTQRILREIVQSWHLPSVSVSYYIRENQLLGKYVHSKTPPGGLLVEDRKVELLKLIPSDIKRVVLIDPTTIVLMDIKNLWEDSLEQNGLVLDLQHLGNPFGNSKVLLVNLISTPDQAQARSAVGYLPLRNGHMFCLPLTGNQAHHCVWFYVLSNEASTPSEQIMKEIVSYDGYQLQDPIPTNTAMSLLKYVAVVPKRRCEDFRIHKYRVHPYFIGHQYQPVDEYDVTMITHLSLDRMHMLERLLALWDGPISASVYTEEANILSLLGAIDENPALQRENIAIHIVYKKDASPPFNFLRNFAWKYSNSPYIFINDVDCMPNLDTYQRIRCALKKSPLNKEVFVLPAFETTVKELEFPRSKEDLTGFLQRGEIIPFRATTSMQLHGPTNYHKWLEHSQPYSVEWKLGYGPYVVMRRNSARFNERFDGFGTDKIWQQEELHAMGYRFIVLPDVYIIHNGQFNDRTLNELRPKTKTEDGTMVSHCIKEAELAFLEDLRVKYGYIRA